MADYSYPSTNRLVKKKQFDCVFNDVQLKVSDACLAVLMKANSLGTPRLGLVIPRRILKRAVDRNKLKRILRESFRHRKHQIGGYDLVILAKPGLKKCSNLNQQTGQVWNRVLQCIAKNHQKIKPDACSDQTSGS